MAVPAEPKKRCAFEPIVQRGTERSMIAKVAKRSRPLVKVYLSSCAFLRRTLLTMFLHTNLAKSIRILGMD